jgi:hypothetical protein
MEAIGESKKFIPLTRGLGYADEPEKGGFVE